MGRGYKGALCEATPPQDGGWMNREARRGCIRRQGHRGYCRNRFWEWQAGQTELAWPRADKVDVPAGLSWTGGFLGAWRKGYAAARWDRLRGAKCGAARSPYTDWRTDRGAITFARAWGKAWREGYDAGWKAGPT